MTRRASILARAVRAMRLAADRTSSLNALIVGVLLLVGAATLAPARALVVDSDAVVALGRLLFFDAGLSEPPGQACATCHEPGHAFTDPDTRQPTSKGAQRNTFGRRNTPTAMYMAFSPPLRYDAKAGRYIGGQFRDGRAATLEEQAQEPLLDPVEMANPDKRTVVAKVRASPRLVPRFEALWGPGALDDADLGFERLAAALAAYQRSSELAPFSSKYDAFLAGRATLTADEARGLALFVDTEKGNCAGCHPSVRGPDGAPPLFTAFTYANIGVPRHPHNPFYTQPARFNPAGAAHVDLGLGAVVNRRSEHGKFKVPTLRNIDLTTPYMHNGYFASLRAVVAFHVDRDVRPRCTGSLTEAEALERRCWPAPEVAANVDKNATGRFHLTEAEIDAVVAFLGTLTDGYEPEGQAAAR